MCERLLGTVRREGLDLLRPLSEDHLRRLLSAWVRHANVERPHLALGPGIPAPPAFLPAARQEHRHRLAAALRVVSELILGGLHHDYRLEKKAA